MRVLYFAPDATTARFEARALLGSFFHRFVPAPGPTKVVVSYRFVNPCFKVVDATEPQLPRVHSTIQEMTGDWFTYPRSGGDAPTQELAHRIYHLPNQPTGLLAPSARNPHVNNLIVFTNRLPPSSLKAIRIDP